MRSRPLTLVFLAHLLACSDDEGAGGGGTGPATSSSTSGPTAGTSTASTTASSTTGAGGEDCIAGSVEAVIGPEGGLLAFCGAVLEVPAGALAAETTFGIGIDPSPPPAPFERELASLPFVFSPEVPDVSAPLSLSLPHDDLPSRFELARVIDGTYQTIEACEVTPGTIQQWVFLLGGYAALRDVNDYPDGPSGLGDGIVDLTFLMADAAFDVDAPGNYAIFASQPDGGSLVTLRTIRDVPGGIESLRADLAVDAGGQSGALIQVEWISTVTSEGFSYIDGLVGSGGSVALATTPGGRLVGELMANVQGGNPPREEALVATFDVAVEKYAFPPELVCPGGKKPGP